MLSETLQLSNPGILFCNLETLIIRSTTEQKQSTADRRLKHHKFPRQKLADNTDLGPCAGPGRGLFQH